jgi:hypothetical protein
VGRSTKPRLPHLAKFKDGLEEDFLKVAVGIAAIPKPTFALFSRCGSYDLCTIGALNELCCTNRLMAEVPHSPDGFTPRLL